MNIRRIIILITLLYGTGLFAQSLNSATYKEIKKILLLTSHQRQSEVKVSIERLTPEPSAYLVALASDPQLRIYAKQKAISLLQYYPTSGSEVFLRARIADASVHRSLRASAAQSYAGGFYRRDAARVEAFLRSFQADRTIGVSVLSALRTARIMNREFVPDERQIEQIRRQRQPPTKNQ